jgi:hypothetical protein
MIKKIAIWTFVGCCALIALGAILGGGSAEDSTTADFTRNTPPAIEPAPTATPSPVPAKPAKPKAWRTIFRVSGQGSKRTNEFRIIPDRKTRLVYTFTGGTNAILDIKTPTDGEYSGDNLLNEIGDRRGSTRPSARVRVTSRKVSVAGSGIRARVGDGSAEEARSSCRRCRR